MTSSRKLVLYTLTSLDGAVDNPGLYFSADPRPGTPPVFDEEMVAFETETIAAQDAVLLGRGMYDEWSGYWPNVTDDPFADFINDVAKYVVTSRPLAAGWANATAVHGPLAEVVRDLKALPGRDIGVHGSIELARSLLRADLVDELRLIVGPVLGCGGRRLVEPGEGPPATGGVRRLALQSATPTPSGGVLSVYVAR